VFGIDALQILIFMVRAGKPAKKLPVVVSIEDLSESGSAKF
jgi:hypothetical protein